MASPRPDLVLDAEASCVVSPYDQSPMIRISEATSEQDLDNVLSKWCTSETQRLEQIARDHPTDSPRDVRLEYLSVYLLRCGAPSHVVQWAILKQIIEDIKTKDKR